MANYSVLNKSISKFLWAYVFILFNISIGTVDVLPDFIGYILMAAGIFSLSKELGHSPLLKILSIIMSVWSVIYWGLNAFSVSSDILTYISSSTGAVDIVLNFLFLTDLSVICKTYQTEEQKLDKKLITARNIYTFCIAASVLSSLSLLLISKTAEILIVFTVAVSIICIVLLLAVMILIFQGLSGLKKITENLARNAQNCCVPFSTEENE